MCVRAIPPHTCSVRACTTYRHAVLLVNPSGFTTSCTSGKGSNFEGGVGTRPRFFGCICFGLCFCTGMFRSYTLCPCFPVRSRKVSYWHAIVLLRIHASDFSRSKTSAGSPPTSSLHTLSWCRDELWKGVGHTTLHCTALVLVCSLIQWVGVSVRWGGGGGGVWSGGRSRSSGRGGRAVMIRTNDPDTTTLTRLWHKPFASYSSYSYSSS